MNSVVPNDIAQQKAAYFGDDEGLFQSVARAVESKYVLESLPELPRVWDEDVALIFLEFDGQNQKTLLTWISTLIGLSRGARIFILLKQADSDFIVRAIQKGAQGVIEVPGQIDEILSIIHMQDRRKTGKNGKLTVFYSLKGGVGCTCLGTNTAAFISELTKGRTVLVDTNIPLGDTLLYLSMENQKVYSISDFIHNENRFNEELIYESLSQHEETGLFVLPLPQDINELDLIDGEKIKKILTTLRHYFDHVVVDTSSDLSDVTLGCLDEADNIALVTEPTLSSLRAVNEVLKIAEQLGYSKEIIKLIVNRYDDVSQVDLDEIIEGLEVKDVTKITSDFDTYNESLSQGKLVQFYDAQHISNDELYRLANLLHNDSYHRVQPRLSADRDEIELSLDGIKQLWTKLSGKKH
ncbi:MAG: AAA family ATPase [Hydrogenovibrio sp.]|uniref:AAA family ATPase n=1 Tax=Hydrogenovibrio sp. TaxID=2065821 RepID=UPI00286FB699|nr:AAA family ATPase [Hydrogenovibrio sp.]MDR9497576.1 AAA family ATPase [Hydrogenovibrio sp.]